ncbi:hypothetical protein DL96DRAFT_782385 [Flagelloscypha sp. PMI_526]|nr:hypothetical protein DL96DRAFT_782385 [Flagelloscypha sp. PMI_526]
MPQLSALPASWLSATYHSNATRIIAFSLSCIAVTVQLGASLSHEIESYIELSTLGIAFERSEIIKHMGLSVVFLGLLLRYYWLVWRKGSSIPRGVDLVLHVGEMGLFLWTSTTFLSQVIMREPFTLWDINTVCLLYIPSAMFLLVAKILDVVHSDNGI